MTDDDIDRVYTARRFERDLIRLFRDSGWTVKKLAEKEGRSEAWIEYCLRVGRFPPEESK